MNLEAAFAEVEKNEDYVVDILQKIIAVDTSIPPGENYGKLIDIVEPEFNKFGLETERVVVPEDKVKQMPWWAGLIIQPWMKWNHPGKR